MKLLICDRCKAEYTNTQNWAQAPEYEYRVQYIRLVPFFTRELELCRDCQKDFNKFMLEKQALIADGGDGND